MTQEKEGWRERLAKDKSEKAGGSTRDYSEVLPDLKLSGTDFLMGDHFDEGQDDYQGPVFKPEDDPVLWKVPGPISKDYGSETTIIKKKVTGKKLEPLTVGPGKIKTNMFPTELLENQVGVTDNAREIKLKNDIVAIIKLRREEMNLSQQQLATDIGMTTNNLYSIERGNTGITVENLLKICEKLKLSILIRKNG